MDSKQLSVHDVIEETVIHALETMGFKVHDEYPVNDTQSNVVFRRNDINVAIQTYYNCINEQYLGVEHLALCIINDAYYSTHDLKEGVSQEDVSNWIAEFEEEIKKPNPCLGLVPQFDEDSWVF